MIFIYYGIVLVLIFVLGKRIQAELFKAIMAYPDEEEVRTHTVRCVSALAGLLLFFLVLNFL